MKKCPNCGTILDDSKKKCYMCGTSLNDVSSSTFLDNFDNQIGAINSNSQDNVFNNGEDIEVLDMGDLVDENDTQTFYSSSSNSMSVLGSDITSLNAPSNSNSDVQSNNSFSNMVANDLPVNNSQPVMNQMPVNQVQNNPSQNTQTFVNQGSTFNTTPVVPNNQSSQNVDSSMAFYGIQNNSINNMPEMKASFEKQSHVFIPTKVPDGKGRKKVKEQSSKEINWGNDLSRSNGVTVAGVKLNGSLVFNSLCFLVFIGMLVFVYFKFLRSPSNENVQLGSLTYTIDDEFILSRGKDSSSNDYSYGNSCSVKVNYGPPSGSVDDAVETYLDNFQKHYEATGEAQYRRETLKIGDNTWYSLYIDYFVEDASSTNGYKTVTRYKYISILYDADLYYIIYSNPTGDNTCSLMFDEFLDTLRFD